MLVIDSLHQLSPATLSKNFPAGRWWPVVPGHVSETVFMLLFHVRVTLFMHMFESLLSKSQKPIFDILAFYLNEAKAFSEAITIWGTPDPSHPDKKSWRNLAMYYLTKIIQEEIILHMDNFHVYLWLKDKDMFTRFAPNLKIASMGML